MLELEISSIIMVYITALYSFVLLTYSYFYNGGLLQIIRMESIT